MADTMRAGTAPGASEGVLSPAERFRLIATATGAVLLFYVLAALTLALLGLYLLCGALVALAAIRFGMTGRVIYGLRHPEKLARLVIQSLVLPRHRHDATVEIEEGEAPRLLALLDAVSARVGVDRPHRIVFEMGCNAGVALRGYLTGSGRSTLALGLDLLAGLSEPGLEAILAHEMAHARLVQRGYRAWLRKAIARAWRLAGIVDALRDYLSERGESALSVTAVNAWAGPLALACGRLESTYSRQDEFAADQLACSLTGTEIFAATLQCTESLARRAERISWHERVVQARRHPSFIEWLSGRLRGEGEPAPATEPAAEAEFQEPASDYDSHPPLAARLAALPQCPAAGFAADVPAIGLIRDPGRLAERLIERVESVLGDSEAEETRRLKKRVREGLPIPQRVQTTTIGAALLFIGFLFRLADTDGSLRLVELGFGAVGLATVILPWLRRPEPLPAPALYHWEQALRRREAAQVGRFYGRFELDPPVLEAPSEVKGRKALADYWADQAYDALLRCEYERASGVALRCLTADAKRVEGLVCQGIAGAYGRSGEPWQQPLSAAVARLGLTGPVPRAVSWACALAGDWESAEGYAALAAQRNPRDAAAWTYLSWIQWTQDRNCVALQSARRAIEVDPEATDPRLILVRILLDLVHAREARDELAELERLAGSWAARDFEILVQKLRIPLLLGELEAAKQAADRLLELHPEPKSWVAIGNAYWGAWHPEEARAAYERALEQAFFPNAWLQLGDIAAQAGDPAAARSAYLRALDLTREVPEGQSTPFALLPRLCHAHYELNTRVAGCTGWVATFPLTGTGLNAERLQMLILARTRDAAEMYAREFYLGLLPATTSVPVPQWEPTDVGDLSKTPVPPGVHRVVVE